MEISSEAKDLIIELSKQAKKIKDIRKEIFDRIGENVSERTVIRVRVKNKVATNTNSSGEVYLPIIDEKRLKRDDTTFKSDGSQTHTTLVQMDEEQSKDPDFVLRSHGYDPDSWDLIQHVHNIWQQHSIADGTKDLMQSKITVKPKINLSIDKIIETMTKDVIPLRLDDTENNSINNMVLPLSDLHLGITKITDLEKHFEKIIKIIKIPHNIFVIEQLGDLFHSSQMLSSQTLKSTMLDEVDMVQAVEDAKTFFDIIIRNINANKIIIKQMAGNHSGNMEYMFMEYLKAKYPDIEVDNNIKYRDAYLLGNIGIMLAHGDFARKGLVSLFPNEFKKIWGQSNQVYIHSGHFHTQKTTEDGGIIWQQFGTVKPNDKYEISNGWTLSKKTLYLIEYSSDELLAEYYV